MRKRKRKNKLMSRNIFYNTECVPVLTDRSFDQRMCKQTEPEYYGTCTIGQNIKNLRSLWHNNLCEQLFKCQAFPILIKNSCLSVWNGFCLHLQQFSNSNSQKRSLWQSISVAPLLILGVRDCTAMT